MSPDRASSPPAVDLVSSASKKRKRDHHHKRDKFTSKHVEPRQSFDSNGDQRGECLKRKYPILRSTKLPTRDDQSTPSSADTTSFHATQAQPLDESNTSPQSLPSTKPKRVRFASPSLPNPSDPSAWPTLVERALSSHTKRKPQPKSDLVKMMPLFDFDNLRPAPLSSPQSEGSIVKMVPLFQGGQVQPIVRRDYVAAGPSNGTDSRKTREELNKIAALARSRLGHASVNGGGRVTGKDAGQPPPDRACPQAHALTRNGDKNKRRREKKRQKRKQQRAMAPGNTTSPSSEDGAPVSESSVPDEAPLTEADLFLKNWIPYSQRGKPIDHANQDPQPPPQPRETSDIAGPATSVDAQVHSLSTQLPPTPPTTPQKAAETSSLSSTKRASTKTSPYFPKTTTRPKSSPKASTPTPPLTASHFGLIQELLAQQPFHLLLAVILLNKTSGRAAIPTLFTLIARYPTPRSLAIASVSEITAQIAHLGLQNSRARTLIALARTWCAAPPSKHVRHRTLHYPFPGAGADIKPGTTVGAEEVDARTGAFEIAHLPGVGAYALDSWRIFCRDVLRGVAAGWNGEGAGEGFEAEWKRVRPEDKELRAFLGWMWERERLKEASVKDGPCAVGAGMDDGVEVGWLERVSQTQHGKGKADGGEIRDGDEGASIGGSAESASFGVAAGL